MHVLPARDVAALRPWFTPERPGPLIWSHIAATGHGRCRVDRWPGPRVVLAELGGGNYALRGDPDRLDPDAVADLTGFVDAPAHWLPALRRLDPGLARWDRLVAALPDDAPAVAPAAGVARTLGVADVAALADLHPRIAWIHETWGGAAGLAASGLARAAFIDGRPVSVAVPFFLGERHEDIGVVTDPGYRGRGLSTACAAAVVADIRSRGRRPTWTTSPDNAGSLAVAARLGFVRVREDVLHVVRTTVPDPD
jgi:GNAT superfamily N-acetyltransferase